MRLNNFIIYILFTLCILLNTRDNCYAVTKKPTKINFTKVMGMVEKGERFIYLGQYQDALPIIKKAYTTMHDAENTNNVLYARIAQMLGELYIYTCDYTKAMTVLTPALDIWQKSVGKNQLDYIKTLQDLAGAEAGLQNTAEAAKYFEKAKKLLSSESGQCSFFYGVLEYEYGCMLYDTGNFKNAAVQLKHAAEIFKGKQQTRDWRYTDMLWKLAEIYQNRQDNHNAELALLLVADSARINFGKDSQNYAKALLYLSNFYKEIGKSAKGKSFRKDAKAAVLDKNNKALRIKKSKENKCRPIN